MNPVLQASDVHVTIAGNHILRGVSVDVSPGEVVGLIGPNGAGKSTLLAALAGDVDPDSGTVVLQGKPYAQWSSREAARQRAVMLQDSSVAYAYHVRDVVAMGRHAWARDEASDAAVDAALEAAHVAHMADRQVTTLSGGERARVALARVVAQHARCVLLDEPTAAMDIRYQELTLHLARRLAQEGAGVVVVLHDLGAAARFCDRLVLLHHGAVVAQGSPEQVCTEEILSEVYDWPLAVSGDGSGALWIRPAGTAPSRLR
ncbi:heme ABC transporter ATP-binding protein [Corynebacterium uberis]|uniref:heme ABC transporter ATP-binding protein n=1 Tax=Corynebacterium TaxID=1716 RepID=UPI001D0A2A2D|nr:MULTISPECIES: heme ABC transporter ATP-binding protein [Corynebacterium]MCZ9309824.1 heme ABC transporter ATP-binding protein [Corynebacterium sp. c6VSa_13]UDL73622.1 heme ABC transporter ATP-binding protein [Corynebacterium uberis]UDL75498.1 heme ABC transporter ATP-binding protein [Corynebacterium uberis]UDL77711.1 heme ABC transporter ATP-binding protein [Corynebacterium uberis]UDL79995.1 heme ABC transporter ATP-binding protein [Corynebacterium uberis]